MDKASQIQLVNWAQGHCISRWSSVMIAEPFIHPEMQTEWAHILQQSTVQNTLCFPEGQHLSFATLVIGRSVKSHTPDKLVPCKLTNLSVIGQWAQKLKFQISLFHPGSSSGHRSHLFQIINAHNIHQDIDSFFKRDWFFSYGGVYVSKLGKLKSLTFL